MEGTRTAEVQICISIAEKKLGSSRNCTRSLIQAC